MSSRKIHPTRSRAETEAAQRAHGHDLRGWLQHRADVAAKAIAARKKKQAAEVATRPAVATMSPLAGVPGRAVRPDPTVLVAHDGTLRAVRRQRARDYGIPLPTSSNEPYRNPKRRERLERSGRLRRDLP